MTTEWINPADCVDMDCDARRKVLITDLDGTFFGESMTTAISQSEFGWDGDSVWGLGRFCSFVVSQINIACDVLHSA